MTMVLGVGRGQWRAATQPRLRSACAQNDLLWDKTPVQRRWGSSLVQKQQLKPVIVQLPTCKLHRNIESQNGLGWKKPPRFKPLLGAGTLSTSTGSSKPCPTWPSLWEERREDQFLRKILLTFHLNRNVSLFSLLNMFKIKQIILWITCIYVYIIWRQTYKDWYEYQNFNQYRHRSVHYL